MKLIFFFRNEMLCWFTGSPLRFARFRCEKGSNEMSRQSQLNRIKQAFGWKKLEEVLTGQEGVRPILMSLMGIQLENKSTVAVGQTSALTKLYPLRAIPYSLLVRHQTLKGSAIWDFNLQFWMETFWIWNRWYGLMSPKSPQLLGLSKLCLWGW